MPWESGCVDELMRQALVPVLHDLEGAAVAAPRIEAADRTGDPDWPSVMLWSPTGNGMGVQVSRLAPMSERIASVADQVQEFVIEELWGQAPTSWPPCPRHPTAHPMRALAQDDTAVWVCPVDDSLMSVIGRL
jgi:hypothetical protein